MMRIVPDTSVIIEGLLSKRISKGEFKELTILVHEAVVAELENQASKGREEGIVGLDELKKLQQLVDENKKIRIEFSGVKPSPEEIRYAKRGAIDASIRKLASEENAQLYTMDLVQAKVAEAKKIPVQYVKPRRTGSIGFEKYFDKKTMSVHLKEGVKPLAKKGVPGDLKLVELSDDKMSRGTIKEMIKRVVEECRANEESHVEINRRNAMIAQISEYRIAIAEPPFSKGYEITVVKPIVKKKLSEYDVSKELLERLESESMGVVVSGPPGSGKSTFATAVAEYLERKGKIVKTIEAPRDLQVSKKITQYTHLEGSSEKTADILLMVRPDYTIYDEIRKTQDFRTYIDMRMAGIGLIGTVHASRAIDAIHRMTRRLDIGSIPQIIDTIIFLKGGEIRKTFEISIKVKVPQGMMEKDLARPVVEVRDFRTKKPEYELYVYGEEKVILPIIKEYRASYWGIKRVEERRSKVMVHVRKKAAKKRKNRKLQRELNNIEKYYGKPVEVVLR